MILESWAWQKLGGWYDQQNFCIHVQLQTTLSWWTQLLLLLVAATNPCRISYLYTIICKTLTLLATRSRIYINACRDDLIISSKISLRAIDFTAASSYTDTRSASCSDSGRRTTSASDEQELYAATRSIGRWIKEQNSRILYYNSAREREREIKER